MYNQDMPNEQLFDDIVALLRKGYAIQITPKPHPLGGGCVSAQLTITPPQPPRPLQEETQAFVSGAPVRYPLQSGLDLYLNDAKDLIRILAQAIAFYGGDVE